MPEKAKFENIEKLFYGEVVSSVACRNMTVVGAFPAFYSN
jgi:hypothetical protein